jgi:hypothetical protein
VERQTGRSLKELDPVVEFPDLLANVWSAFCDLSASRTQGFSSVNPITYSDIKDYREMTNATLSPKDIKTIRDLDAVYMRIANG